MSWSLVEVTYLDNRMWKATLILYVSCSVEPKLNLNQQSIRHMKTRRLDKPGINTDSLADKEFSIELVMCSISFFIDPLSCFILPLPSVTGACRQSRCLLCVSDEWAALNALKRSVYSLYCRLFNHHYLPLLHLCLSAELAVGIRMPNFTIRYPRLSVRGDSSR